MPLWRRWWFRILGLIMLAVAGMALHVYWQRSEAAEEVRQVLAELDQVEPDWRLDQIEARRGVLGDDENGALAIIAVFEQLPKAWKTKTFGYDPRQARESLHEIAKTPPPNRYDDEVAKQLREELQAIQPTMAAARKLIHFPQGRFPVEYSPDFLSTQVPNHQGARAVANILILDTLIALDDGRPSHVIPSVKTLLNIGRTMADDPLLISQLIRLAMHGYAVDCLERALAQGVLSDGELASMPRVLLRERDENLFLVSMRGERAGSHQFLSLLENGNTPITVMLDNAVMLRKRTPDWWDYAADVFARKSAFRSHSWLLRYFTQIVEAAEMPEPDRYRQIRERSEAAREFFASGDRDYGIAKLLAPAVEKVADAEQRADTRFNCTIAGLAAERFRLKHDRWPNSLDELVQAKLLAESPEDLYDGKPIRLRRTPDGIVFYSIGPDGNYEGDALDWLEDFNPNRTRIEFRLWDPAHRRQPPLPPRNPPENP